MSKNTSQSISPAGLTSGHSWISEATLTRCVPWFRAVLDCLLITFGAFLAINIYAAGSILGGGNWRVIAFLCGQSTLGIAGVLMVYLTARSSFWRQRERVLACLSVVLLLTSGLSLVSLLLIQWPESMNAMQMFVAGLAVCTLICMGMIAVEKRMLSGCRSVNAVERSASVRQTFGRIFLAGMAFFASLSCLLIPAYLAYGVFTGSLLDDFQSELGESLNNINYLSLILLAVSAKLYLIFLAYYSWSRLAEFHRPKLRPYCEYRKVKAIPLSTATMALSVGSFVYFVLLAQFHISVNTAPWALLALSLVSYLVYRKASKDVAAQSASA